MAVDHVIGEEHRDLQPTVLDRRVLQGAVFRAGDRVEGPADAAGGDFLEDLRLGHFRADTDQAQLPDLFIDGHLLEQVANEGVLVLQQFRLRVGQGRVTGQADEQAQQTQLIHEFDSRGCNSTHGQYCSAEVGRAAIVVVCWGTLLAD
ncbi:hypothetical protein D3C85_1180470 [compost metagenome]